MNSSASATRRTGLSRGTRSRYTMDRLPRFLQPLYFVLFRAGFCQRLYLVAPAINSIVTVFNWLFFLIVRYLSFSEPHILKLMVWTFHMRCEIWRKLSKLGPSPISISGVTASKICCIFVANCPCCFKLSSRFAQESRSCIHHNIMLNLSVMFV